MDLIEADEFIRKLLKTLDEMGITHHNVEDERVGNTRYKNVKFSIKIK